MMTSSVYEALPTATTNSSTNKSTKRKSSSSSSSYSKKKSSSSSKFKSPNKKSKTWQQLGDFSQEKYETSAYEYKVHPREFLQVFILTKKLINTKQHDTNNVERHYLLPGEGELALDVLFSEIEKFAADNTWLCDESCVFSLFRNCRFRWLDYDNNTVKIKCPSFFYEVRNVSKIQQFSQMISDMIHTLLHKMYVDQKNEYIIFKTYQFKEFEQPELTMKDNILNSMYNHLIIQCSEAVEKGGFKHFSPSSSVIEAVIDGTHSVVYLGYCNRESPDGGFELDSEKRKKKYAVVTAYFCCEPVMVDFDRIVFQYRTVKRIGLSFYAVIWENREITFEEHMKEQWENLKRSEVAEEIVVPQHDPHPNEEYCEQFLPDLGGTLSKGTALFQRIYNDMKKPYWRIFCKLPKTNQFFEPEKELIEEYMTIFGQSIPVHFLIYGLSLLLGRLPDALRLYLIDRNLYNTFSAVVYEEDVHFADKIPVDELEYEEDNLKFKLREITDQLAKLWKRRSFKFSVEKSFELEALKENLMKQRTRWESSINKSYHKQATIAVNRMINDDDENDDLEDDSGDILPKSMRMVMMDPEDDNYETTDGFYYKYDDISRGITRFPVGVINSVDQTLFDSIQYMYAVVPADENVRSEVQRLREQSKQGCNCQKHKKQLHECSVSCPCVENLPGYDEKGKLTSTALLSADFFIYECNQMCDCDPTTCSNRVLQKGSQHHMLIFKTVEKGWGVKTLQHIPKGTYVDEYIGELIGEKEAEKRGLKYDQINECSYLFDVTPHDDNCFSIDAIRYCSTTRWFNHSCDPNLVSRPVSVEVRDHLLPRIGFFALKDIAIGEELSFNYSYEIKNRLRCRCGAANCSKWLM